MSTHIDPTIFRSYDIRGLVATQLTDAAVERLGQAYGTHAGGKGAKRVSIGRDCRDSSPRIRDALIRGITSTGVNVVDVGCVATPMQYFSLHHLDVGGGVMITGSHNPPEYNGFKLSMATASMHGEEIQALRGLCESGAFNTGAGEVVVQDIVEPYAAYLTGNLKLGDRKLKVVVDGGNGTAGPFAVPIFEAIGVDVVPLYIDMDPTFPNHHPDPTVEANLVDLKKAVAEHGADLGVAFDGDGDRVGVVDEAGQVLWGDQLMILFSRAVLAEVPGAAIVAEVKCSQTLYDDITAHGGDAIMWKTGHSLIKDKMKAVDAALAGEMSGHIFFKHRFFGFDDATYASGRLLELLSRTDQPLSALLSDVPKTFSTAELRVDCPETLKFPLVAAAVAHFKAEGHDVIDIDGARVTFDDGWGLVRASNTGPLLVLRFEAATEGRLAEIRAYVEGALQTLRADLEA